MFTLAIAAALGAVAVGTVGFLGSGEKFEIRKFLGTVITGVISGATIAAVFGEVVVTGQLIALAFLAGTGADGARVAISNAIAARANSPK